MKVDDGTVRWLNSKVGRHSQHYHDHEQKVQDVRVTELQADERTSVTPMADKSGFGWL